MRLIILESIAISNFRSITSPVIIQFPPGGLIFLTGVNQLDPSLGSNGSGKSTIWDALVWCLYGTSVRGQRASELAPWSTRGRPNVIVGYTIDGVNRYIERIGSPDTLKLDGEVVSQEAVDDLMGLSRTRFVHSVVFGQASQLFMDLTVAARGELLAEVMDLDYWARMAEFAAEKHRTVVEQRGLLQQKIAADTGRHEAVASQLAQQKDFELQWQATKQQQIEHGEYTAHHAQMALGEAEYAVSVAEVALADTPDYNIIGQTVNRLKDRIDELKIEHTTISRAHQAAIRQQIFFRDNKLCPTCGAKLDGQFGFHRHKDFETEADEARQAMSAVRDEWTEMQIEYANALTQYQDAVQLVDANRTTLRNAQAEADKCRHAVEWARKALEEAEQTESPYVMTILNLESQARALRRKLAADTATLNALEDESNLLSYWRRGFLNVRLFIIRRILTVLELETAAAASSLGVGGWHIAFATETETKSGNTSSRLGIYITATNPRNQGDYRSYSFGEAQRIKLAVSLGLSALIQSMSGVYHSIEVFDEPTQWLSPEGVDDLLQCLDERAEATGKAIWLSDHRSLTYPFTEIWQVVKSNAGTSVTQL